MHCPRGAVGRSECGLNACVTFLHPILLIDLPKCLSGWCLAPDLYIYELAAVAVLLLQRYWSHDTSVRSSAITSA